MWKRRKPEHRTFGTYRETSELTAFNIQQTYVCIDAHMSVCAGDRTPAGPGVVPGVWPVRELSSPRNSGFRQEKEEGPRHLTVPESKPRSENEERRMRGRTRASTQHLHGPKAHVLGIKTHSDTVMA